MYLLVVDFQKMKQEVDRQYGRKNTKDEIINVSSNTEKAIKARNRKETTKKYLLKDICG